MCLCLSVKEEEQSVKRERDICEGGVMCGFKNLTILSFIFLFLFEVIVGVLHLQF